ncbi:MAG: hypothetical protein HUJ59_03940 [Bacilli bacterium]|nr:hypothetical protein [Bacilli bacterium]
MKNVIKSLLLLCLGTSLLTGCVFNNNQEKPKETFTITFKNYDKSILETQEVKAGEIPSCNIIPTKPSDDEYDYTFRAWSPKLYAADRDQSYLATYTPVSTTATKYTITFKNYDGSILETKSVKEGTVPSCSITPTREEDETYKYTFKGWSPSLYAANKNQTYTATYTKTEKPVTYYTITFKNYDGSILETKSVKEGTVPSCGVIPTKPEDETYKYTFKGWSPSLYAANKDQIYTATFNQKEKSSIEEDAWTILIYMCGSDLESENGLATSDLKEIKSVSGQPDDVNIVVQTGGCKSWERSAISSLDKNKSQRWHLENKTFINDSSTTKVNMGLSSTLQDFLTWGMETYPAEKTGVIFWNHGGGMFGVCYDEQYADDSLDNYETQLAFKNAFASLGRTEKIEFIGYDACLMNVQDVAEFNSQFANYMVASEESEAGEGWDYDNWLDDLYEGKSTTTILTSICDSFVQDVTDNYGEQYNDQQLSVLDLSKMNAYLTAWESFADALNTKFESESSLKSTFKNTVNKAKRFAVDEDNSEDYFATYDAKDFLTKIKGNSQINPGNEYIDACLTALENVVIYSKKGKVAGNANGIACFYAAKSGYGCAYGYLDDVYYKENTNFSNWRIFNENYGG